MRNKRIQPKNIIKLLSTAMLSVALAACGGGSGDGGLTSVGDGRIDNGTEGPTVSDLVVDQTGLLPDFSVVSIAASAATFELDFLQVQVTITNNGDAAAFVPDAWFAFSDQPDDNTNFQRTDVTLVPLEGSDLILQPGETGQYEATNGRPGITQLEIARSGTNFGWLILNPDLSERFLNPEPFVVESYELEESDYSNNRSELISFETEIAASRGDDCQIDAFEENDSAALATPIITNTIFEFNACDEAFDVMSIELVAGTTYEIMQHRDLAVVPRTWLFTVISPENEYLRRDETQTLITPTQSGTHLIVARTNSSPVSQLFIEVIE